MVDVGTSISLNSPSGHVHQAAHTIQGQGSVSVTSTGSGVLNFSNHGVFDANVPGGTLFFDSPTSLLDTRNNGGIFRASAGGILNLTGGIEQVNGGVIEALAGSTVELDDAGITAGTIRAAGDGVVRVLTTARIRGGTFHQGQHEVAAGAVVTIRDVITNEGNWRVLGDGAIRGDDPVVLTGGGSFTLVDTDSKVIANSDADAGFINQADHAINGQGAIDVAGTTGTSAPSFINRGLIDANVPAGTLFFDSRTGLLDTHNDGGVFRASNGGILNMTGVIKQINGGVVEALAGSRVELDATRFTAGTFSAIDDGLIRVLTTARFRGDTLHQGQYELAAGAVLTIRDVITNEGNWRVLGDGVIRSDDPVVLTGGGSITFVDPASSYIANSPADAGFINQADHTIEGQGFVDLAATTGTSAPAFINRGLVDANASGGTLFVDTRTNVLDVRNDGGILRASNGGILNITGFVDQTNGAVIEALAGSRVELDDADFRGAHFARPGQGGSRPSPTPSCATWLPRHLWTFSRLYASMCRAISSTTVSFGSPTVRRCSSTTTPTYRARATSCSRDQDP